MELIEQNILNIKSKVKNAAERSGRRAEEISIVAVTKTFPPETIQKAVDLGIDLLGENRVQEAMSKIDKVKGSVKWHLIGHLQKNKVKKAITMFSMIQSLDSLPLAQEIQKRAMKIGKTVDVLVQINIGREKTKFGIDPNDAQQFIRKVAELPNLKIKGIMAVPPYKPNPEDTRVYFRALKDIFDKIKKQQIKNVEMKYLSMGMSNDFEVAIEEGANMVRIGTSIFGARTKQIKEGEKDE